MLRALFGVPSPAHKDAMYRALLRRNVDLWLVTQVAHHAGSCWRNADAKALRFALLNRFFESTGLLLLSK